jgi:hypothetical protein
MTMPIVRVFLADPRVAEVELSRADARQVGRHLAMIAKLAEGRLSPKELHTRRWRPPPGDLRLVDEAAAALALVEQLRAADRLFPSDPEEGI